MNCCARRYASGSSTVSEPKCEGFDAESDLSMELVANQAVRPGWTVPGSDQFRRTVASGL